MSSYLPQSGTDYIPHLQPFSPNLNFYQAALERKEAQYKEGYNKVNGIYGTLLNSPMLGTVDNETRDKFFKDIETNIQKISNLDLSLEENVDSAYKAFQPIIDDKNIMKNIAWTKGYQNEVSRGESERMNFDKDGNSKYWDQGIQALHYQAEDFAKAADSHNAGSMGSPRYVPKNNTYQLAIDKIKKEGFKTTNQVIGKDGFLHTYTNGDLIQGGLSNYLMGAFGNDPAAMDAANTQAYVDRKNFVKSNTNIYGSEDAAETAYLSHGINALNKQANSKGLEQDSVIKTLTAQINIDNDILKKDPHNSEVLQRYINNNDQLEKAQSTKDQYTKMGSYISHENLLGADKEVIRRRVDNAVAISSLSNELLQASKDYSQLTAEHKLEVNPYAMKQLDHSYDMAKMERQAVLSGEGDYNRLKWKFEFDKLAKEAPATSPYFNVASGSTFLPGNTTADQTNPSLSEYEQVQGEFNDGSKRTATDYSQRVYDSYKNIIDSKTSTADQKTLAEKYIKDTYGPYLTKGTVLLKSETLSQDPNYITRWRDTYNKAKAVVKSDKYLSSDSFTNSLTGIEQEHDIYNNAYLTANNANNKNNLAVKHFVDVEGPSQTYTPEVKRNFGLFMNDKGTISNPEEFKRKLMSKDISISPDQADEIYSDLKKTYTTLYNQDKLSVDPRYNVIPWEGSVGLGGGAKGAKSINYNMRADQGTSDPVKGLVSAYDELSTVPGAFISKGGVNGFINEEAFVKDEKYDMIAKAIIDDTKKGKWNKTETIPAGKIIYQGIIAGNKDLSGITFIPSHETVEKYIGKPKQPGITAGEDDLEKTGFTIVLPTRESNNLFKQRISKTLAESIIDHDPYKVDKGEEGTYTVKKTADGYFTISGNYNTYDNSGNRLTIPIDPGEYRTSTSTGLTNVLAQMDNRFNGYKLRNQEWKETIKKHNSRK